MRVCDAIKPSNISCSRASFLRNLYDYFMSSENIGYDRRAEHAYRKVTSPRRERERVVLQTNTNIMQTVILSVERKYFF